MAIETRTNDEAGRAWLAERLAAGGYMIVNERQITELTGDDAPPPPTPTVLSARQFWLAIEIMGYGPAMDALVAQLPKLSQIAINKATEFDRTFPQFVELSKYIGTPEQIAALFEYGATL